MNNTVNTIAKIAPDEIVKIVNAGGANVVDWAKVPTRPSAPNKKKNIIIGAVAGFVVSFSLFFIYELFDTTITNSRDIEREFDIPVLGTVPKLDAPVKSNYGSDNSQKNDDPPAEKEPPLPKASQSLIDSIQSAKEGKKNV